MSLTTKEVQHNNDWNSRHFAISQKAKLKIPDSINFRVQVHGRTEFRGVKRTLLEITRKRFQKVIKAAPRHGYTLEKKNFTFELRLLFLDASAKD